MPIGLIFWVRIAQEQRNYGYKGIDEIKASRLSDGRMYKKYAILYSFYAGILYSCIFFLKVTLVIPSMAEAWT